MIVYQCPFWSGTLSEIKDLNNMILVWTCLNKSLRSPFNLTMMWNFISIRQWCEFSWNGWKFEERAQRMCNFPASPSTPPADKCCVIPTTNFRRKKLNWKSIHFESGRQSTHPAASIWLNSHFSTFSSGSIGAFRQKLQLYIFCQSSLFWVRNFSGSLLSIEGTAIFTRKLKEKKIVK